VKQRKPLPQNAIYGIIAGAAVLVALVGYMLVIKPQKGRVSELKSEIENTRQTIDTYKAEAAAAQPGATPKIQVADIYRLARAMPGEAGMADIVLELSAIGRATGVEIDGIGPQQQTPGNGFNILPINVSFHGDFYSIADFLYRIRTLVNVRHGQLEAGGRLFAFDMITLTPQSEGSQDLKGTGTLQTFVYGSAAAAAAAAAALPPTTTSTSTTTTTSGEGAP
jgi:Tfp pilus assembly protein PilO